MANAHDAQISVGIESEFGTAVVPAFSVPVMPGDGIQTEQNIIPDESIDTLPGKNRNFALGVKDYSGGYEMNAYPVALGYLFLSALGAVSSDTVYGETEAYEHVFTEDADKPSLTVEQKLADVSRYAGYILDGLTLTGKVDDYLKIAFTGMAKTVADASAITAAYETAKPFSWRHIAALSFNSVDLLEYAEEISLEYKNGLGMFHGFNTTGEPTKSYVGRSEVTGSITAYIEAAVLANLKGDFEDGTEGELLLTITGDAIGIASNYSLQISIPRVILSKLTTPLSDDYYQLTLDLEGAKNTSGTLITVTLVNTKSGYTA